MRKILVSLFDNPHEAFRALRDLEASGFGSDASSMIVNDIILEHDPSLTEYIEGVSGRGQSLSVPGIGSVQVMGPLSSGMMSTSTARAMDMPVVTTLMQEGVPEADAHAFAEGVRRGGTLILVTAEEMEANRARDVMGRHRPLDIHDVSNRWQRSGWSRFDANARPLEYHELDWPHNIVARPGERDIVEPAENWPQDIAARGEEKHEMEEEIANWPENITEPDRRTNPEEEVGTDWPHNITAREDEDDRDLDETYRNP